MDKTIALVGTIGVELILIEVWAEGTSRQKWQAIYQSKMEEPLKYTLKGDAKNG